MARGGKPRFVSRSVCVPAQLRSSHCVRIASTGADLPVPEISGAKFSFRHHRLGDSGGDVWSCGTSFPGTCDAPERFPPIRSWRHVFWPLVSAGLGNESSRRAPPNAAASNHCRAQRIAVAATHSDCPLNLFHQASFFRELLIGLVPCGEVGFITRRARRALASIRCSSRPGFSGSHSRRAIALSAVFIFSGKHSGRNSTIAATTACCHGYFVFASIAITIHSDSGSALETWLDRPSLRACLVRSPAGSHRQLGGAKDTRAAAAKARAARA